MVLSGNFPTILHTSKRQLRNSSSKSHRLRWVVASASASVATIPQPQRREPTELWKLEAISAHGRWAQTMPPLKRSPSKMIFSQSFPWCKKCFHPLAQWASLACAAKDPMIPTFIPSGWTAMVSHLRKLAANVRVMHASWSPWYPHPPTPTPLPRIPRLPFLPDYQNQPSFNEYPPVTKSHEIISRPLVLT